MKAKQSVEKGKRCRKRFDSNQTLHDSKLIHEFKVESLDFLLMFAHKAIQQEEHSALWGPQRLSHISAFAAWEEISCSAAHLHILCPHLSLTSSGDV